MEILASNHALRQKSMNEKKPLSRPRVLRRELEKPTAEGRKREKKFTTQDYVKISL